MTLTVRQSSVTGATTANRELTYAEMDANWAHVIQASNQNFTPSGTGAQSTDLQTRGRLLVYATDFMSAAQIANVQAGGLNPTVDVTTAISNAVSAATTSNLRTLIFPAGSYLISSKITFPTAFTCIFSGVGRTIFVFRPTADATMFAVDASGSINYNSTFQGGFTCYSDDTSHVKIAFDLVDVSSFDLNGIYVYGTGTGNTWHDSTNASVGIRTRGRDSTGIKNYKLAADKPVSIEANPNTAATDGEDMDHWDWINGYLLPVSNYAYTVADGIGVMNSNFGGYQAWVGGTGGFFMNDTRVAPTVPSRNIRISNFRTEQCTVATGYGINITATQAIQQIAIENGLIDSTTQGISINSAVIGSIRNVTTARSSGNCLNYTGTESLRLDGFYPQSGSTFTVTGLGRSLIDSYDASSFAGPQSATYVKTRTGSAIDVDAGFFGSALCPPSANTGARQTASQLWQGTGAPSNSFGANNDFYLRGDGSAGTFLYHKAGGSWTAFA